MACFHSNLNTPTTIDQRGCGKKTTVAHYFTRVPRVFGIRCMKDKGMFYVFLCDLLWFNDSISINSCHLIIAALIKFNLTICQIVQASGLASNIRQRLWWARAWSASRWFSVFQLKVQYTLDISQCILCKEFRGDTPRLARKGEVWFAFSEFLVLVLVNFDFLRYVRAVFNIIWYSTVIIR